MPHRRCAVCIPFNRDPTAFGTDPAVRPPGDAPVNTDIHAVTPRDSGVDLSIVSPVYHGAQLVVPLVTRLEAVLAGITERYEIILVEDGSPDESWTAIASVCATHPRVVGVRLSRNFGQHYALTAGLRLTRGNSVVVMDCDLQDKPEEIPKLLLAAQDGADIVLARRAVRQDAFFTRLRSRLFYRILTYLTGVPHDAAIANFGVYRRKVIDAINRMPESIRYFPTMVRWVGFRVRTIDVAHDARAEGRSSYTLGKLLRLATDIILANSDKPLRLVVKTGFIIATIGLVFAAYMVVRALRGEIVVLGYASLIVSLWVLAGLIIMILGVVGLYIGKIFEGVKQRPPFIVSEVLNAHE
ncbi:MAG: glycosyltransferase family 2 protein [Opitutus sp.]